MTADNGWDLPGHYTGRLHFLRKFLPIATLGIAIPVLYFFDLNGVGVISPDEPRYAAIGETMARTGHLITPCLWGSPWFEKPPLLYWMTALATWSGWRAELAGRVPVAVLSLAFLAVTYILLNREFGGRAAAVATGMLATSAGWLAYSSLCLTDVPLAACFCMAVFLALPLLRQQPRLERLNLRFASIGVFLGLGALAKGLVPLALAVPFFWFLRAYWRKWWVAALTCFAISLPWYIAVYLENGDAFVQEFFVKHHFERLYSASLQHVQPWYYYFPVVLLGLFPWTPLIGLLLGRDIQWERRKQFLAAIVAFGFVMFSVSRNKLPGYPLPFLPCLLVLIGSYFENKSLVELPKAWLVACAVLIAMIPLAASILPASLVVGRFTFSAIRIDRTAVFYIAAPLAVVLLARRSWIPILLVLAIVAGGIYLKAVCYPVIDDHVSARGLWRRIQPVANEVCDGGTNRDWIYGLNFYKPSPIPYCGTGPFRFMMRSVGRNQPTLTPVHP